MKNRRGAFTLIELLIVVAIIGILAAIAIPNFLEAQVRAKVAKVQSEFRNMKGPMYIYKMDTNEWPDSEDSECVSVYGREHSTFWNLRELSTPVPYMSDVPYQDPFSTTKKHPSCGGDVSNHYQYWHWGPPSGGVDCLEPTDPGACIPVLSWVILNVGPAQVWPHHPLVVWGIPYDPTNGTTSQGTLWVSEAGIFGD